MKKWFSDRVVKCENLVCIYRFQINWSTSLGWLSGCSWTFRRPTVPKIFIKISHNIVHFSQHWVRGWLHRPSSPLSNIGGEIYHLDQKRGNIINKYLRNVHPQDDLTHTMPLPEAYAHSVGGWCAALRTPILCPLGALPLEGGMGMCQSHDPFFSGQSALPSLPISALFLANISALKMQNFGIFAPKTPHF